MLLGRECFSDFARFGYWRFWLECICRYRKLTLRDRDGLERGPKMSTGRRKARYATRIFYLVPWEWEQRGKRGHSMWCATDLGMRLGTGFVEDEEVGKIWESYTCLCDDLHLLWLVWLVGFHRMPMGIGGWDKGLGWWGSLKEKICIKLPRLMLRSSIHMEFSFVQSERYTFSFLQLHVAIQFHEHYF